MTNEVLCVFLTEVERQQQERLLQSDAFEGDVDDILSEFLLFQFHLKEPQHKFAREHLFAYVAQIQERVEPSLTFLFGEMAQREMIRRDIDLPDLVAVFKTVLLGLTSLWAMEVPPFAQTAKVMRLQMKLFSEGLKAGEAYEV